MARTYQLKRRAERQDATRQRIVQATVDLHTTVGPSRATISAIAARAGVQRHTFYRHFPDERTLWDACSARYLETHPLPDFAAWQSERDPETRLRRGLTELYAFWEENGAALEPIIRDAAVHSLTQEIVDRQLRAAFDEMRTSLAEPFRRRGRAGARLAALIGLFLEFHTWRTLRSSLPSAEDVMEAAVHAIRCG